jgi:hypothetical protein
MERIAFNKAVARKAREMENFYKRKTRNLKAKYAKQNRLANLPRIKTVYINSSYINPVSLFPVPSGIVVYKVRDPKTGRIDYYAKDTFWKLMIKASNIKNNHNLMMASPRPVPQSSDARRHHHPQHPARHSQAQAQDSYTVGGRTQDSVGVPQARCSAQIALKK